MIRRWRDYPLRNGIVWMGRYRIDRFLGMGSYGQAYACTDTGSGRTVLLKRNKPSKKEIGRLLLRRESRILRELRHPRIPKWIGYETRGRDEALIMELVEGDDLESRLMAQGRALTLREALCIAKELLRTLGYLHGAGFVHRDVRIPNVMAKDGAIYLIDYGLACRIGEQLPEPLRLGLNEPDPDMAAPGAAAGSDSWSAFKRKMRRPLPSSDLYGLGHLFLFIMYAGYEPEEGQAERSWEEELALPRPVVLFVRRLLELEEPGWQSADQCLQELDRLMAELQ
ncbi:protein kinase [Paenibacillus sp. IB182493]|uniref:Protein kinase n=2 Tax=Paenibacillus arenilitoris TaxID=2772299 RepID=A0A927CS33_9BACL|nr:protein kinase [Paenibacillus arenilitoris]